MKKVTYLTPDGLIVRVRDESVIGWKCTGCSTSYVDESIETAEQMADYIFAMQESHESCGMF